MQGMYDEPPASMEVFTQRHVECMGEESDHLHIVAITDALLVRTCISYTCLRTWVCMHACVCKCLHRFIVLYVRVGCTFWGKGRIRLWVGYVHAYVF